MTLVSRENAYILFVMYLYDVSAHLPEDRLVAVAYAVEVPVRDNKRNYGNVAILLYAVAYLSHYSSRIVLGKGDGVKDNSVKAAVIYQIIDVLFARAERLSEVLQVCK